MPTPAVPTLSPLVAGAWRLADWDWRPAQRLAWIEGLVERGLTTFDHADIYGGYRVESLFGDALALAPGLRERLQIVTKCGIVLPGAGRPAHVVPQTHCYDTSAAHLTASVEHSLRALRTDRIDLLLIHRPDVLMDADEVASCFESLRRDGKVLHFGASNFTPAQFELLHSRIALATHQVECSPLQRAALHDGSFDQAQRLRLRPMVWSPLAGGRLFHEDSPAAHRVRWVMGEIGARLGGVSATTLAIAWLLRLPCRPHPVIGSRRLEAADEARAALDLRLSADDWYRIWTAAAGHEVP
ncbi:aldo/keto reductase family oxidoreductase [Ideonella sp.]|uniref:aldo/keto reductase n=1 Tax=Ideonella sp. TaxID=1929293 RepID=UPI0035B4BF8A